MALPIPTSSQLLDAFQRAFEAGAAAALRTGQRFSWTATSRLNLLRVATVRLLERLFYLLDDRFRASFLDTAEGADLDAWAASEAPGYPRKAASSATVYLWVGRPGAGAGGTVPVGSRFATLATATVPAVTFAAIAATVYGAADLSKYIPVECDQTGEAGNVALGTITRIVDALWDSTFTCTNGVPAAGGSEAEEDDDYRDRLRQRDARMRRGTVEAVRLGALSVPGVARAVVLDPQNCTAMAATPGTSAVIVGDSVGLGSGPMANRVTDAEEDWRPCGIILNVHVAQALSIVPNYYPLAAGGILVTVTTAKAPYIDTAAIETGARAALQAYFRALQFQQTAHLAAILKAVMDVDPIIRNVALYEVRAGPAYTAITSDISGAALTTGQRWDGPDAAWDWSFTWATET